MLLAVSKWKLSCLHPAAKYIRKLHNFSLFSPPQKYHLSLHHTSLGISPFIKKIINAMTPALCNTYIEKHGSLTQTPFLSCYAMAVTFWFVAFSLIPSIFCPAMLLSSVCLQLKLALNWQHVHHVTHPYSFFNRCAACHSLIFIYKAILRVNTIGKPYMFLFYQDNPFLK